MKKIALAFCVLVILALAAYGAIQAFGQVAFQHQKQECRDKVLNAEIAITAYFPTNTDFSKIQRMQSDAKSALPDHNAIALSSNDRLKAFVAGHASDKTIQGALATLDANPFEPTFEIRVQNGESASNTIAFITQEAEKYGLTVHTIDTANQTAQQSVLNTVDKLERNSFGLNYIKECLRGDNNIHFSSTGAGAP